MASSSDAHGAGWMKLAMTVLAPLAALVLVGLKYAHVVDAEHLAVLLAASVLLFVSVFAAVHHAEVVALKVGEPMGSILLALAVTAIETALIVAAMVGSESGDNSLARDTVFSAVAIVLNGVVGLCLLLGAARYREQGYSVHGTVSALSVLSTLAVLSLILPNFTVTRLGPQYSPTQLIFVGVASILLYGVFVFVQSVRHRDYFLVDPDADEEQALAPPSAGVTAFSGLMLVLSLTGVVLLAKTLAPALEHGIRSVGLPVSFLGVVIATLVLLPESVAAVNAARANKLQISLNLAIGSAIASIGLTIPTVAAVSLYLGKPLTLGLDGEGMTVLMLTLFVSTLTLATGRATILQGAVHLVIFGVFLLFSAVP
ncbi:ionic transporter y4hA [Rhodoblastus acidophilus]|uniref:Ionic transporter y4hA n=1 Tax=Candidatus Rhodoblastus alkanivorans TaxID=2954117 RepID=A0ABS9ZA22_9HYPH|nr:ionic transporter y4hA [Candidatus Rhodoblastus alkanivorans]MCI4679326.1 ionic transporter y4hA [Candidatus Rhodoblastus alkanivorans]MCI4684047.1 ionic transporter y4hA [Candidatus Rhodoblastus alkanivorans]MDI4641367.1 ionic transporter y4hA [Rhodoblastus acidophilus]